jgi:hypothetical protein
VTRRELEILERLQRGLEGLYRLDPAPSVAGFLVERATGVREELLIVEDEDLYLGLVLDPALGAVLGGSCLADENVAEFCLLVEGVSHYLFVVYCVRERRRVSALELEIQGEIDKYVACLFLARRAPSFTVERIRGRLYESFELRGGLDPALEVRYSLANALARRYTRLLEERFVRGLGGLAAMLRELRRFYRMGSARKREIIGR